VTIGSTIRRTALALATVGLVTASSGGVLAQGAQPDGGDAARTSAIDAENPEGPIALAWQLQVPGPIRSTPLIANGVLYAVDAESGAAIWQFESNGRIVASPLVASDVVYVATLGDVMSAVDRETGTDLWYTTASNDFFASPVVADGLAYAASVDGNLYAVGHDESPQAKSPNDDDVSDDGA
jgi:hypothetical protein